MATRAPHRTSLPLLGHPLVASWPQQRGGEQHGGPVSNGVREPGGGRNRCCTVSARTGLINGASLCAPSPSGARGMGEPHWSPPGAGTAGGAYAGGGGRVYKRVGRGEGVRRIVDAQREGGAEVSGVGCTTPLGPVCPQYSPVRYVWPLACSQCYRYTPVWPQYIPV